MVEMTGGCLCGQVRYSANAEPAFVGVCHCTHCQKQNGNGLLGLGRSSEIGNEDPGKLKNIPRQGRQWSTSRAELLSGMRVADIFRCRGRSGGRFY